MLNIQNFYQIKRSFLFCFLAFGFLLLNANYLQAATFTVTNVNNSGAGSLRQAIIDSNTAQGINGVQNVINFSIAGGVVRTVNLTSALPDITYHLIIDGTTMAGYSGTPLFELNGANAGAAANGLTNRIGDFEVKALIINRFGGDGIEAVCPSGGCADFEHNILFVTGSYIGIDKLGITASPNSGNGIYYQPHRAIAYSTIGGQLASERNIISGNGKNGVLIRRSDYTYSTVAFVNNFIGINVFGAAAVGNTLNGISTEDSPGSQNGLGIEIGNDLGFAGSSLPPTLADRNIISGNGANGFFTNTPIVDVSIKNSFIGTNSSGTADVGNVSDGIKLTALGNQTVQIGGSGAFDGNVISGNNGYGIESAMSFTIVQNNRIGTNALGTASVGNSLDGVRLFTTNAFLINGCYIGGSNAGEGNLISGNTNGVTLDVGADGTRIEGNKVGVNLATTATIPNTQSGIVVKANNIGIGFANNAPSVNIIGGNAINGIWVTGHSTGVDIFNNYIGTNASDINLGNASAGVFVAQCGANVRIGADAAISGAANTIAYNGINGVLAWDTVQCVSIPAAYINVAVRRNSIYSNGGTGIDLAGTLGISANDTGDADTGPNGLQNFPTLLKVSPTQLYGTLNSKPNQTYAVDFFQNTTCDSTGNGEGKQLLGSTNITTNGSGNATYNLTGFVVSVGQVVTATATDSSGNTSEFSPCLTVTNNPGNVSFNVTSSSGAENSGVAAITIDRVNGASGTITIDFATQNGTAIAGTDYTTTTTQVTFLNGETLKTILVPLINNTKDEPSRTFTATLSNPSGGAFVGNIATHIFTITDDDPPPTVSISDVSILEGNQGSTTFSFNVSLSAASGLSSSVNYSTANGTATATQDYSATNGTVNFAPNEVLKTATVTVNGDLVPEINETFFVNLATPTNLTINDGQAIGTILDDDNPGKIELAFATYSVAEGSANATITLTRTNGSAGTSAVNYVTANGTATAGSDYTETNGTATFNDGQTSTSFNIPIIQDVIGEGNETVFISISNPLGGATLGTQTNAVLTIFDDDGGLPANVAIGGQIVENALPLSNVLVTLNGSQTATALTDASGNYSFANLPSAGNFLVTPTLNGYSFEPQSISFTNLAANITNANFVGSTGTPSRNLKVVSNGTISGQDAAVEVILQSQGNENSVGFSIGYNSALVFNPQVSLASDAANASLIVNNSIAGRLGVILALPAGQSFAAGNRQLVKITFNTASTTLFSTPLAFSDSPIIRKTADANANGLPTSYYDGLIGFSQGFEADVASRPAGDGFLAVDDFTQVGRFVAGLDTPDSPVSTNEFQRADCSPRGIKGDGVLAVDDFTQAGRYAAGLDASQKAGGATQFGSFAPELFEKILTDKFALPRDIRVVNNTASPGTQVFVSVETDAIGDENGYGFTLNYDQTKLSAPLVAAGTGTQGTFLIPNTNTAGKVGVIIAFSPGSTIQAGTKQLVTIRFTILANATSGLSPLTFGDSPVIRKVSDANAVVLAASFTDGSLNILGPTAANISISGRVLNANGRAIPRAVISVTNQNGEQQTARTNPFGFYRFSEIPAGQIYVITAVSKRYTFASSHVFSATENLTDVDFFAEQ
jgi:Calx-beta domain/Carboxypeptidase regulatory-like domain